MHFYNKKGYCVALYCIFLTDLEPLHLYEHISFKYPSFIFNYLSNAFCYGPRIMNLTSVFVRYIPQSFICRCLSKMNLKRGVF